MEKQKFSEVFAPFIQDEEVLKVFEEAFISSTRLYEQIKTIEIDLIVPNELDRDAIVRAAENIKAATNLQIVSINTLVIEPHSQTEGEKVRLFSDLPLFESKQGNIYGKSFKSKPVSMKGLNEEDGRVTIWGDVFNISERTTKDGRRNIIVFSITDYSGSFKVKIFDDCSQCNRLLKNLKDGCSVMVRGDVEYDKYLRALVIKAIGVELVEKEKRKDKAEQKRVELHLHTNMSAHDGLSSATDLINRAHSWGHKAVAITDHGVVQAYPEAAKAAGAIAKSNPENKIKILYGMEGYLVDDSDGDEEAYKKKANHIVLLAQNDLGRKNLYKLVSKSHTQYFYRTPRIPRSELIAHREGLLLGSACEAGEVYRAVLAGKSQDEFRRNCLFL